MLLEEEVLDFHCVRLQTTTTVILGVAPLDQAQHGECVAREFVLSCELIADDTGHRDYA